MNWWQRPDSLICWGTSACEGGHRSPLKHVLQGMQGITFLLNYRGFGCKESPPQIWGFSRHHCISVLPYHNTVGSLEERKDQGKALVSCSSYGAPVWILHKTTMKELSGSSSERVSAWQIGVVIEVLLNWLRSLRAWGLLPD